MAIFLASFPNSRTSDRPSTTDETITNITIPKLITPGFPVLADVVLAAPGNLNRTGLRIRNLTLTESLYWSPDAAQLAAGGGDLIGPNEEEYIDTDQAIYVINHSDNYVIPIAVDEGSG